MDAPLGVDVSPGRLSGAARLAGASSRASGARRGPRLSGEGPITPAMLVGDSGNQRSLMVCGMRLWWYAAPTRGTEQPRPREDVRSGCSVPDWLSRLARGVRVSPHPAGGDIFAVHALRHRPGNLPRHLAAVAGQIVSRHDARNRAWPIVLAEQAGLLPPE